MLWGSMMFLRRHAWTLLLLAAAGGLQGAGPALKPDEIKQTVEIETITIPSPGEIFTALDKQSQPNWVQLKAEPSPGTTDSRPQIALMLGTLVTDGYVAVEAQDGQAVKNIGKDIINLAKKLNVSQNVLSRGNSLNDFAESNDWNVLREELEATQNEVKLTMAEQKDDDLVILVTLGAWIRGIDLASGIVQAAYTPAAARLLHQTAIVEYLIKEIDLLPAALKGDPLVADLRAGLVHILGLVKAAEPSEENVKALHEISGLMLKKIMEPSVKA